MQAEDGGKVDEDREMDVRTLAQVILDVSCSFFQIEKPQSSLEIMDFDTIGIDTSILFQFIQEAQLRTLRVLRKENGDGVRLSLENVEKDKTKMKQKTPTFYLIKTMKTREKLRKDVPFNSQLQILSMGTEDIGTIVTFVQQSFNPFLQAQEGNEEEGRKHMPLIRKRLKELEVAMVQFQNNVEIPEVELKINADIQAAADLIRGKTGSIDVEALGFGDRLTDMAFLNEIQAGVNRWIKEIQKVTSLVKYVFRYFIRKKILFQIRCVFL